MPYVVENYFDLTLYFFSKNISKYLLHIGKELHGMFNIFLHSCPGCCHDGRIENRFFRGQSLYVICDCCAAGFVHVGEVVDFADTGFYGFMVVFRADAGTAMHNDRDVVCQFTDILDDMKVKLRLGEVNTVSGAE